MNNGPADEILGNLLRALHILHRRPEFADLVPEVRVNLAYALPGASSPAEVAAVEGRITAMEGFPRASGLPRFGASDHMARLILESRRHDPAINAGINFKWDETVEGIAREYCRERGMLFGWIDRTDEPEEIAAADGASMPWKISRLVEKAGGMPRLFYEGEGWGKEPLFVAVGGDAVEVAEIAGEIAVRYRRKTGG